MKNMSLKRMKIEMYEVPKTVEVNIQLFCIVYNKL